MGLYEFLDPGTVADCLSLAGTSYTEWLAEMVRQKFMVPTAQLACGKRQASTSPRMSQRKNGSLDQLQNESSLEVTCLQSFPHYVPVLASHVQFRREGLQLLLQAADLLGSPLVPRQQLHLQPGHLPLETLLCRSRTLRFSEHPLRKASCFPGLIELSVAVLLRLTEGHKNDREVSWYCWCAGAASLLLAFKTESLQKKICSQIAPGTMSQNSKLHWHAGGL